MPPLAAAVAAGAGTSSDDPVVLEIHRPKRVPPSLLLAVLLSCTSVFQLEGAAACVAAGAAAVRVGAGAGAATGGGAGWLAGALELNVSVTDPHQRETRLPLSLVAPCETEVLQAPADSGAALGAAAAVRGGAAVAPKDGPGTPLTGSLMLSSSGRTSVLNAATAVPPAPSWAMILSTSPLPPDLRAAAKSASASLLRPADR